MKILSLTNSPLDPKSGSGKTVLFYSQGLQELAHSVDVLEPKEYETLQGINKAKKFRQAWGAWSLVKRKLQTQQYDLIEFYGDEFWLTTWELSKSPMRPLLVAHTNGLELLASERENSYTPLKTIRDHLYQWFSQQTHARFSRTAFAYADAFVSLCELDRKYVLQRGLYPLERTAVVEPGLDEEYLSKSFTTNQQERIAFTGSWIPRKGVSTLCAVMSKVLAHKPELYLDLYGTGMSPEVLLASFPNALRDRIVVHPRLSNQEIAEGLTKAKIFFFPSQYEGFGIALAEAMACSCAVVTTPTGFGAELRNEHEALLYDFNDLEGMTQGIFRLLQDDKLRLKISHSGWERVRSLTWETNIKRLEAIYSKWIAEHHYNRDRHEPRDS